MSFNPYPMRMAPPVRHSRSLEGLEQVIPPKTPFPPFGIARSELFLNKPLPTKPLPEEPLENTAIWSDSSDSESTVDSIGGPSELRDSTDHYPIFVSSGSDDFDLVDHPAPSADHPPPLRPEHRSPSRSHPSEYSRSISADSAASSIAATSILDAQYGRLYNWSQNPGSNHYFREKKWDFFPELAPSAVQANNRMSPQAQNVKRRKKDGHLNLSTLNFSRGRRRFHSLEFGLPHVRDSIKTYVHRTLSKGSTEDKSKDSTRPATAPLGSPYAQSSSHRSEGTIHRDHKAWATPHSSVGDVSVQMRALSISTHSSASTFCESPHRTHRQKQLAVPLSPYQKYGATIWEKPKKSKKRNVRFPKHHQQSSLGSSPSSLATKPLPPLSPPLRMQLSQALHDGTGHVLVALDGAKKKMAESKENRRRELLKKQIRLVGPVNPHTYVQNDPWA